MLPNITKHSPKLGLCSFNNVRKLLAIRSCHTKNSFQLFGQITVCRCDKCHIELVLLHWRYIFLCVCFSFWFCLCNLPLIPCNCPAGMSVDIYLSLSTCVGPLRGSARFRTVIPSNSVCGIAGLARAHKASVLA